MWRPDSVLPVTWTAFAFAAVSGVLLFASNAMTYAHNNWFLAKFAFIALAGINMLVFQTVINRNVATWGATGTPPATNAPDASVT